MDDSSSSGADMARELDGDGDMDLELELAMGSGRDLRSEVLRLSLELEEATEEKLQAARYGLVVLEESSALKSRHRQLEEEHEGLRQELQQLKEVRGGTQEEPGVAPPPPPHLFIFNLLLVVSHVLNYLVKLQMASGGTCVSLRAVIPIY